MTQLPSESERRRKVGMKCPLNLTCCYHLSTCLLTDHRELVFAGISSSRSRGWIDRQAAAEELKGIEENKKTTLLLPSSTGPKNPRASNNRRASIKR